MTDAAPVRRVQWVLVPIIEPLHISHCWEHTPLDYYRYGEYPRFIRPIGAHQPRAKWEARKCEASDD